MEEPILDEELDIMREAFEEDLKYYTELYEQSGEPNIFFSWGNFYMNLLFASLITTIAFISLIIAATLVFVIPFYIFAYHNKVGLALFVLFILLSLFFAGIKIIS